MRAWTRTGWRDLLVGVPALVWVGCARCGGVIEEILAQLGLATEALTKPEDPIWRVRGPPDELFPPDLDEAGLAVELDAADEDPGEPFFDDLPAHDWAAQLAVLAVFWVAELGADRADKVELTLNSQLTLVAGRRSLAADGWDGLGQGRNGAGGVVQWAAGAFACTMHGRYPVCGSYALRDLCLALSSYSVSRRERHQLLREAVMEGRRYRRDRTWRTSQLPTMAPISHIAAIALAGTLTSTSLSALPRRTTSAPVLTTEQLDMAAKLRADKAAGFAEADIAQFVKPGRWLQTCRTDKGEPDLVRFMVGHLPGASTSPVLQRVDAAVRHQGQRVQMCYEVLLRTDTRTEHRWSVALAVSATSAVSDVSVSGAEGEFSECVARTMGRTKLPSFSSDARTLTVRFAGRVAPGDRDSWLVVPGGHCRQREAFRKVRK